MGKQMVRFCHSQRLLDWGRAVKLVAVFCIALLETWLVASVQANIIEIDLRQPTSETSSGPNNSGSTWAWSPVVAAPGQLFDLEFSSGNGSHIDLDGGTQAASEYYTGTESASNHTHDLIRATYLGSGSWKLEAVRGASVYNMGNITEYTGTLTHSNNYQYASNESDPVNGPAGAGTNATSWEPWKAWFWIYRDTTLNTVSLNIVAGSAQTTPQNVTAADGGSLLADFTFSGQYLGTAARILGNEVGEASGTNPFQFNGSWQAAEDDGAVLGGITPIYNSVSDFVWHDLNANGIQDVGEPGVQGVTVNLLDNSGNVVATTLTDSNGHYEFKNKTPANYRVEFIKPGSYDAFSASDQGVNDAVDSDANTTTGRTSIFALATEDNENTWDAGLFQYALVGDYVWLDMNENGIQDFGEPALPGVTVNLLDDLGVILDTTTSDMSGNYSFTDLVPGQYELEFQLLAGYAFSPYLAGGNPLLDSNANLLTGRTGLFTLISGQTDFSWSAGMYELTDPPVSGVPEPSIAALLVVGSLAIFSKRRRSCRTAPTT